MGDWVDMEVTIGPCSDRLRKQVGNSLVVGGEPEEPPVEGGPTRWVAEMNHGYQGWSRSRADGRRAIAALMRAGVGWNVVCAPGDFDGTMTWWRPGMDEPLTAPHTPYLGTVLGPDEFDEIVAAHQDPADALAAVRDRLAGPPPM